MNFTLDWMLNIKKSQAILVHVLFPSTRDPIVPPNMSSAGSTIIPPKSIGQSTGAAAAGSCGQKKSQSRGEGGKSPLQRDKLDALLTSRRATQRGEATSVENQWARLSQAQSAHR